ncbi:helix-turn-helix transcriptional regulator [Adlercreutzia muris]|uniref:helix-turn-helix transcriptional regulator n=1 Tax=Adlercreutzia muris TaxID=1796610 RepID=UPI001F56A068|nr:LuxR C-terminal-related transcriptional regulator [Adlercreutzia muris]
MDEYFDEICLAALSCIVLATRPDPFAAAGFLAALIVVCTAGTRRPVRLATQIGFVACACIGEPFLSFLPVAAYRLMHEQPTAVKLLWVAVLAVQSVTNGAGPTWVQAAVLCAVACLLAIRDERVRSERRGLTQAYDRLRERMFTGEEAACGGGRAAGDGGRVAGGARGVPAIVNGLKPIPTGAASTGTLSGAQGVPQADPATPALFEGLTEREIAVVQLVAEGMDNREISQKLFLSEGTVRNNISAVLAKKNLSNRTQIAVLYYTS